MVTVVAVTGTPIRLVVVVVGLPKAETHEPTVIAEASVVVVWVNVVVLV
jgi:hypothetical protein